MLNYGIGVCTFFGLVVVYYWQFWLAETIECTLAGNELLFFLASYWIHTQFTDFKIEDINQEIKIAIKLQSLNVIMIFFIDFISRLMGI